MKKLLIYNHLGEKVFEVDVFVEGKDFYIEVEKPTPIWFKSLCLVDKEPDFEAVDMFLKKGYYPLGIARIKEGIDESEEFDNQSNRDTRIGTTEQPTVIEDVSTDSSGNTTAKRGPRHRQPKGTNGSVGSRTRKHTSTSGD